MICRRALKQKYFEQGSKIEDTGDHFVSGSKLFYSNEVEENPHETMLKYLFFANTGLV